MNGKYLSLDDEKPSNSSSSGGGGGGGDNGMYTDPAVTAMRVTTVWLALPLAGVGILGNIVSFFVLCHMRKSKLKPVVTVLQALAVSDTAVLVCGILFRSLRVMIGSQYDIPMNVVYPFGFAVAYVVRLVNIWFTVLLTFDRYVAVCQPLHAQRLCTTKKTSIQIAAVVVLSCLFCIPRFFESKSVLVFKS